MRIASKISIGSPTLSDFEVPVLQRHRILPEISRRRHSEIEVSNGLHKRWLKEIFKKRRNVCFLAMNEHPHPICGGRVWIRDKLPSAWTGSGLCMPHLMSMCTEPKYRGLERASSIVSRDLVWTSKSAFNEMSLSASGDGRRIENKLRCAWEMRMELRNELRRRS